MKPTHPGPGGLSATFLARKHAAGLAYAQYLQTGTPDQIAHFQRVYDAARLSGPQSELLRSFGRRMPVLVTSGMWCGDCSQQCPLLARIAEANPGMIDLRFLDRDQHSDLSSQVRICGGLRVPTVIWMAEDYEFVHMLGDRTLSRYRLMAAKYLGPACPAPGATVPPDELDPVLQDWVNEFERVQLLLRLSPRLRQLHAD